MKNKFLMPLFILVLAFFLVLHSVSALTIDSVSTQNLLPGQQGKVTIDVTNNLNNDITDASLTLDLSKVPFISVSSSTDTIDKIKEDDSESFILSIKSANDIKPGDYNIPYVLSYKINETPKTSIGTIGVSVEANPDLQPSVTQDQPVIGIKEKINLKIINKGLADAKFVSVKIFPEGFTLLSSDESYIGTVASDDFDTISFDIIPISQNANLAGTISYTDFNNNKITKDINLPLVVYSRNKALELGIIQQSYTSLIILILIILIILWIVWRTIRKRRKKNHGQKE